jgi:hypothetical protein
MRCQRRSTRSLPIVARLATTERGKWGNVSPDEAAVSRGLGRTRSRARPPGTTLPRITLSSRAPSSATTGPERPPGPPLGPDEERLTVGRHLPEGRLLPPGERAKRRATDVREYEALHTEPARPLRDGLDVQVTADPSPEPDGMVPAGRFGEHDVGAGRPGWKPMELRGPDDDTAPSPEPVSIGRVIGVGHSPAFDLHPVSPEVAGIRPKPLGPGPPADRRDQLRALVGDQPRIQPPARDRTGPAIDHDPHRSRDEEQARRAIARGLLGADPQRHQPHGRRATPITRDRASSSRARRSRSRPGVARQSSYAITAYCCSMRWVLKKDALNAIVERISLAHWSAPAW